MCLAAVIWIAPVREQDPSYTIQPDTILFIRILIAGSLPAKIEDCKNKLL